MKNRDWVKAKHPPMLQELLHRVEAVIAIDEFVILPESGAPEAASFKSMPPYERFCTLRDCIDWPRYVNNGVTVEQAERIMNNVILGNPREEWLNEVKDGYAIAHAKEREM